ncbi:hypothetical protein A3746_22550 [Oleibacter sp. HI0075]|nr:hypothetical protein A3746_22550 [Oleibacter sp. HI0075]
MLFRWYIHKAGACRVKCILRHQKKNGWSGMQKQQKDFVSAKRGRLCSVAEAQVGSVTPKPW